MATEIRVPDPRRIRDRGHHRQWFKKPGDAVKADEPLVELETDKVTLEVNAPAAGVLGEIVAKDGETVGVGALLGSIAEGGAAAAPEGRGSPPRPRLAKADAPASAEAGSSRRGAGCRAARSAAPSAERPGRRPRSRPRAASIPPASPAPARTAASPRATCWRPSPPAAPAAAGARRAGAGARALARRTTRRAKSACR